jgi:DNA (cytosine-5)-methyltransferase 1
MMNELSLFTGAGGGVLGSKLLGHRIIGYVEYDEYCQRLLRQRIEDGYIDKAPIFTDVCEFLQSGAARQYRGFADMVSAGFPCQPFSVSGEGKAENDERNKWPETIGVIRAVRPEIVWLENVPGLLNHEYIQQIFGDLAESGYDSRWCCLSAAEIGAEHVRDRVWILAYANDSQLERGSLPIGVFTKHANISDTRWGKDKPGVDRASDGLASRVERLKAIGNGQVPKVVKTAWEILSK